MSAARSPWILMAAAWASIGVASLSGCVSTSTDGPKAFEFASSSAPNTQIGLTSLMALDTAQTVTIARNPECLYEANPIAAGIFGSRNPSPERVLLTNALYITGHWLLASYLDRAAEAPVDLSISAEADIARHKHARFLRGTYQLLTALGHGIAVGNNIGRGIEPFSNYECGAQR